MRILLVDLQCFLGLLLHLLVMQEPVFQVLRLRYLEDTAEPLLLRWYKRETVKETIVVINPVLLVLTGFLVALREEMVLGLVCGKHQVVGSFSKCLTLRFKK